jgi:hypothetical protein
LVGPFPQFRWWVFADSFNVAVIFSLWTGPCCRAETVAAYARIISRISRSETIG